MARRIKQALAQPHLQLEYSWSKERTGEISGDTWISKSTINCTVTELYHCTIDFCLTACSVLTEIVLDWVLKSRV